MFRNWIAMAFALLLVVLPSNACAVELVFWTTEIHDDRLNVIEFLAESFAAMQDDVTVKVVSVDENELAERMYAACKEGRGPHLIGTGSELLVALGELGCLDAAAASDMVRRIDEKRFYKGALELLAKPGDSGWYGVPFHGWVQGIWYRSDWFAAAGLNPPETWNDMLAAAKRFTDPAKGRYGIVIGTDKDHYASQVFSQIAMSNGAAIFSADGRVVFNSPAMLKSLQFYKELAKYTPPGPQTWRARDYFLQGKLAMLFYSTFLMDDLALERVASNSLTGDNFPELSGGSFDPNLVQNVRMVPFVSRKRESSYGMVNGFGVGVGVSDLEKEAVASFLSFLYQPSQYVVWMHMAPGGMLPVFKDVAESNLFLTDPSGVFRRYGRQKIKDIIAGLMSIQNFGMVDGKRQPAASLVYAEGVFPRMIHRALFEDVSPVEAVSRAEQEVREIVESMKSR